MQAGLSRQRLTFREIFSPTVIVLVLEKVTVIFIQPTIPDLVDDTRMPMAA